MNQKEQQIILAHGDGGQLYHELIDKIFVPAFDNQYLNELSDAAVCPCGAKQIAMTTDCFVVRPRFFPGGDIGRLSICGTVNDLAMSGAIPQYITVGMILEVGLPVSELETICRSMAIAAKEAGVFLVAGDTKVVEKGSGDGIFINTAGVGFFDQNCLPIKTHLAPGDVIIASGEIGDHGFSILSSREKLNFEPPIFSDVNPLNSLVSALRQSVPDIHALRDPTRGGVATLLNEWALASQCEILIEEEKLPISAQIAAASKILGMDPLYMANEGKFIAAIPEEFALKAIETLRQHTLGKNAAIIGKVNGKGKSRVLIQNELGSKRILDALIKEQLPRIC